MDNLKGLRAVAEAFVQLQELRHRADYDPLATWTLAEAEVARLQAEKAIAHLESAPRSDRKWFAALLLLKRRSGQPRPR